MPSVPVQIIDWDRPCADAHVQETSFSRDVAIMGLPEIAGSEKRCWAINITQPWLNAQKEMPCAESEVVCEHCKSLSIATGCAVATRSLRSTRSVVSAPCIWDARSRTRRQLEKSCEMEVCTIPKLNKHSYLVHLLLDPSYLFQKCSLIFILHLF